jgi:hypothetical protein
LTAASATDLLCPNSTAHEWEKSVNNGSYLVVPGISTTAGTSGDVVTLTANGYDIQDSAILGTNLVTAASNGTTKQLCTVTSSNKACTFIDFPDVHIVPAANCVAATAGGGWSYATATWTATCRAGSNNLGGYLSLAPNTGGAAQFQFDLPVDWDTSVQPYIKIIYASGGTVVGTDTAIWTVASACSKSDGSVTDDPAFHAESAFSSQTLATANRMWAQTGQFTAMTSGNNCIAGSSVIIKLTLSGTETNAIAAYEAVLTVPRLLTVQAN